MICLSHSSRPFEALRASPGSLAQRFSRDDRLDKLPEWRCLGPGGVPSWRNNISVWDFTSGLLEPPRLVSFVERDFTANHAVVDDGELLVCGSTFLELCDLSGERRRCTSHNWFAGGHTVATSDGEIIVSCSASDAVLWFDRQTLELTRHWRVPPDVFGKNYDISPADDVREHYIATDYQLAHLNCAYPLGRGRVLITAFIQGSLGIVARNGGYRKIASGYVGAHGGRMSGKRRNTYYFADTPGGALVEVSEGGVKLRRCAVRSEWVHDVLWLDGSYFLFAVSDRNALELWDVDQCMNIWSVDVSPYGETALLLSGTWSQSS